MKFVNLKTCHGLESYLLVDGGLLRLSLVPELLRSLPQRKASEILTLLEKNVTTRPAQGCTAQNAGVSTE